MSNNLTSINNMIYRRGGGVPPTVYLLDSAASTFTRSTTTFRQTTAATLAAVSANVRAVEDLGDGWGELSSIERQWSQIIPNPRAVTGVGWVGPGAGSSCALDATVPGPDGTSLAFRSQVGASGTYSKALAPDVVPITSGQKYASSIWVRAKSGSSPYQGVFIASVVSGTSDYIASLPATWQRRKMQAPAAGDALASFYITSAGALANITPPAIVVTTAMDILTDLMNARVGAYPLRSVDTTSTQAPDDWQWANGAWDTRLATGSWSMYCVPRYASTDLASGDVRYLLTFGAVTDGVRLRHDGTGVLVECLDGGVVVTTSGYLTFAATDRVAITVATQTSKITVNGVSGANAAALTWPTTGALRLGGICAAAEGSGEEIDGRISLPWLAGT